MASWRKAESWTDHDMDFNFQVIPEFEQLQNNEGKKKIMEHIVMSCNSDKPRKKNVFPAYPTLLECLDFRVSKSLLFSDLRHRLLA